MSYSSPGVFPHAEELALFVYSSLRRGNSPAKVRELLVDAGNRNELVDQVLREFGSLIPGEVVLDHSERADDLVPPLPESENSSGAQVVLERVDFASARDLRSLRPVRRKGRHRRRRTRSSRPRTRSDLDRLLLLGIAVLLIGLALQLFSAH